MANTNSGTQIYKIHSLMKIRWIFTLLVHQNKSPRVDMMLHSDALF